MMHNKTNSTHRRVRISGTSELIIVRPRSREDEAMTWNSKKDQTYFRKTLIHDAKKTARGLASGSAGDHIIYECVGLERFLSQNYANQVSKKKRNHIRLILAEQQRQRFFGMKNDECIAAISRASSEESRDKAHQFARHYWGFKFDEQEM